MQNVLELAAQVVALLTEAGMSQRAIANAVGVDRSTVSRDQAANGAEQVVRDAPPEPPVDLDEQVLLDVAPESAPVTGLDGKTYAKPPPKPQGKPTFSSRFYGHLAQLQHHALELEILCKKPEFAGHLNELRHQHREGVLWVQEIIARILAQMHTNQVELLPAAPHLDGEGPA